MTAGRPSAVHLPPDAVPRVAVLGPVLAFLTPDGDDPDAPALLRGEVPPGGVVPLHAHPDPETFHGLAGTMEGLVAGGGGHRWEAIRPGDTFHVPGDAFHAFRNRGPEPAVSLIATTAQMARFLRGLGVPPGAPPPPDAAERFAEAAARAGHRLGTPEENAAVGIRLPGRAGATGRDR